MLTRLADRGWRLAQKTGTYIPFTYWGMIWGRIDKQSQSILDIGCADGDLMGFINRRHIFHTIGMDIHELYLQKARDEGSHGGYIRGDARKLPFKNKSFDTVLLLEIIEHLNRKEGIEAIEEAERIARKQVIISTPAAFTKQEAYGGNPHQKHISFWSPAEMKQKGYVVRGIGIFENWLVSGVRTGLLRFANKVVTKNRNPAGGNKISSISHTFKLIDFLLRLPYYLVPGLVVYFSPKFSGHIICVKKID